MFRVLGKYNFEHVQDWNIKISEWFALFFNQAKNKQNVITKIFVNHEYFGGLMPCVD